MKKIAGWTLIVLLAASLAFAAKRKPIQEVDTDAFTNDTQVVLQGAGDDHMAMAWWIPNEFWEAVLSRDAGTGEADRKAMMDAMSGVSLLAIVQADVSSLGAFDFYPKEEIENRLMTAFTNTAGEKLRISVVRNIKPNLEIVLGMFKPILSAAMGNMGSNMHFFVLNDLSASSSRMMDPYRKGILDIQLAKRNGRILSCQIETPLHSLFVPRRCPNGKEAHISWKYCPWTGKRLEE